MGKFFGGIAFFLVAVILTYFFNLTQTDLLAQSYFTSDPTFQAPHVVAVLDLLHHPFDYFWVIPSWLIAGFLSGFIIRSWKGAMVVSLLLGFVLSLTWIFFMSRYTPNAWNTFLASQSPLDFFGQTIGTGLLLGLFAAGPTICSAYITSPRNQIIEQAPIKEIQTRCPKCGAVFQSKPKFCYKCNADLSKTEK